MDRITPVIGRAEASQPLLASTETRLTSPVRLWLCLLVAELTLFAVSSAVYCTNEDWSFERSLYVSVSIGFGIGLPYRTSEATAVFACVNALVGFALLAGAASLLVRQIVLRQEQVRREVRDEIRESELTHLTMMMHDDDGGAEQPPSSVAPPAPPSGRARMRRLGKGLSKSMRAARGQLFSKKGRRWMLCLLWLAFWLAGILTFAEPIAAVQGPQETKYGERVYGLLPRGSRRPDWCLLLADRLRRFHLGPRAPRSQPRATRVAATCLAAAPSCHPGLLWIISVFTTSSLGLMTPLDNAASYLWAAAFIVAGVPLTATVYASFIDVYIAHVERREARRALLHVAVPSRSTFLSMGHNEERRTLTGAKVDWGAYLEYRLRTMPGTVVHEKLLDGLRATFAAIDRNNNGYIEWRDVEATAASNAELPDRYSAQ